MKRIAFTGPESTGKTTLAEAIALHFNCPWVAEIAREYLTERSGQYEQNDLDIMAQLQVDKWNSLDAEAFVIYDTDMTVYAIWSEVKYGSISPVIQNLAANQHIDHYFLCSPDIPWEDDPLRENPHDREKLFNRYKEWLEEKNVPFTILKGSLDERKEKAIAIIEAIR